ncbi:MAG: hypothetical protein A2Y62_03935 [Candidatus Fischerbacteria bacterium RBG_13_37_8]|uniref:Uncharacterized protein n=1 Tax=Candidatus Fischerbacteria bacterium RBG_13_37_8 TaxID=1817863 RepID=A0A1F5V5I2_9BACT|nr:MAG: hypothetical protein A2Y62_03935 [Candidatus Fischerbacteria bacterium RBG_13_37_8]
MSAKISQSPFLDVNSFAIKETPADTNSINTTKYQATPFLSMYETFEGDASTDPATEECMAFLNELYDEEFDQALFELACEAVPLYENQLTYSRGDFGAINQGAERILEQHFEPLAREAERMMEVLAEKLSQYDPNVLTSGEIEAVVDQYRPSIELSPDFDNFIGSLKKAFKKVASRAVDLAKKGVSVATTLGLGPILGKLKPLIKPLLKKVLNIAISKLPKQLQPMAHKLAEKLPLLLEVEQDTDLESGNPSSPSISQIQYEFNQQVADILFAPSEVEQELEIAEILTEAKMPIDYSLNELDRARSQFVDSLSKLKEGEDPAPIIENFLPAILPALQLGIKLISRKRVVDFLAKLLAKLIQRFIGPQYAPALSKAIVDAGLRLISLEASPEDEKGAAGSVVAATIEETVRRVAALPDHILDNQDLLESYALQSFEQAATSNLPPVLPEEVYRRRPDLIEAKSVRGTWIPMPLRSPRKRYKKYSRIFRSILTPHKASAIMSFGGAPLSEFLQEQLGFLPGEDIEAQVHLYEAMPGTMLPDVTQLEQNIPGLGSTGAYVQLHPLTQQAASTLLEEPALGRDVDPHYLAGPFATEVGQRFYYLEIPGKRPLMTSEPSGRSAIRHKTRVILVLDFRGNQIRLSLYLSEIRAQEIALKLRQQEHTGAIAVYLGKILERGLNAALKGGFGSLKIIHESVTPDRWAKALQRLPVFVTQTLLSQLQQWVLKELPAFLQKHSQQFISAAEQPVDGVTLLITIENPTGLAELRKALKSKVLSLKKLKLSDAMPNINIRIAPGYQHE